MVIDAVASLGTKSSFCIFEPVCIWRFLNQTISRDQRVSFFRAAGFEGMKKALRLSNIKENMIIM